MWVRIELPSAEARDLFGGRTFIEGEVPYVRTMNRKARAFSRPGMWNREAHLLAIQMLHKCNYVGMVWGDKEAHS